MCRLSGDEGVILPMLVHSGNADVHDKDIQCKWFELVNSGHLYRILASCAIIYVAIRKEPHMSDFVLTC